MKKDTEEVTRPDVLLLKYDMDAMRERWLRTEHKYDCISAAQKNINIKTNIVIATQIIILILLGVT